MNTNSHERKQQRNDAFDNRSEKSEGLRLYEEARRLMDAGDIVGAIEMFIQSAYSHPHHKTYELIGECYLSKKELSRAVLFLAAATTLNQGARSPSLLARAWYESGRLEKALDAAEVALQREPNNKEALNVKRAIEMQR